MNQRRFPPPWTVEDIGATFVVTDSAAQKLAYVYFEDEPGRRKDFGICNSTGFCEFNLLPSPTCVLLIHGCGRQPMICTARSRTGVCFLVALAGEDWPTVFTVGSDPDYARPKPASYGKWQSRRF
jgi:hypothetical protein